MDYLGIVKRAYEINLKHKYLWILGILAGGLAGSGSFNFSLPDSTVTSGTTSNELPDYLTKLNIQDWIANYWGIIIAVIGLVGLLFLGILILQIIFQGGILGSVKAIEEGKENNFKLAFIFGWHKFWRVLGVGILMALIVIFSLIVLILPITLLVLAKAYIFAVIFGIIIFLIDMILWVYIGIIGPYIQRIAVLQNKGALEAIQTSWEYFQKNWKDIVIMYILVIAIGFGIFFVYILGLLILGGLLFAIGLAIFVISKIACIIYAVIAIICLILVMMGAKGVISSFFSTIYTLTFLQLYNKKA